MALDPALLAALAAAAFAGSVIFGVTGFGAALVTVPFATHFVPLPFALALYVLMDLANAFRIGFESPRNAVRAEWTRMIPTILAGTAVGLTLLVELPRGAATFALGVFVFAFAVYSLSRHPDGWCLEGTTTCAHFFGGQSRGGTYALMWQWSGGGGTVNGHGDFDQIDANLTP